MTDNNIINNVIERLRLKLDMTRNESKLMTEQILSGKTNNTQNAQFLDNLALKGETDQELLGMLDAMNNFSLDVLLDNNHNHNHNNNDTNSPIDVCGTGGDQRRTFNISTATAFVIAAAGGRVAKHGNRSNSGLSGSADIFEYFGYDLYMEPSQISKIFDKHHICFIFAQKFHPAMKNVAAARKMLDRKRTAFNLLGPLSNPAKVTNQLIGVSNFGMLDRIPSILQKHGSKNVMTVMAENGMDEFSTASKNFTVMLKDDKISKAVVNPQDCGLHMSQIKDIQVSSKEDALKAFVDVLSGTANKAMTETVALNAAAGMVVAGIADDIISGTDIALSTIYDQRAFALFERFVADTGDITKIPEVQSK